MESKKVKKCPNCGKETFEYIGTEEFYESLMLCNEMHYDEDEDTEIDPYYECSECEHTEYFISNTDY